MKILSTLIPSMEGTYIFPPVSRFIKGVPNVYWKNQFDWETYNYKSQKFDEHYHNRYGHSPQPCSEYTVDECGSVGLWQAANGLSIHSFATKSFSKLLRWKEHRDVFKLAKSMFERDYVFLRPILCVVSERLICDSSNNTS